ncbi:DESIGUAL/Modifying wall lignin-1/2 [Dillenia turbinata]|uniref:DESIGUAL/Modifying wall lignin-1/2 n=1 Tax=Dillenia turbinata TaxID=194707 RepID=A0AAN8V2X8_9MAGN
MGERKGSTLVHLLVIVLSLVAFGFAIAAERRRSVGHVVEDDRSNRTYCVYNSDVATGYGVGGFLFLLTSESLLMGVTKCMCFGRPLAPGGDRAWSIIYFASSWVTFLVAEACLVAGATKNAYHTKYWGMIYADNLSCETLRKGVFIAGAVFVVVTMILNMYYHVYFTKATTTQAAQKAKHMSSTVGMAGYA